MSAAHGPHGILIPISRRMIACNLLPIPVVAHPTALWGTGLIGIRATIGTIGLSGTS